MGMLEIFSCIHQMFDTIESFYTTPVSISHGADEVCIFSLCSVCFGGCRILAEQRKADRKVNKGKHCLLIPSRAPKAFEATKTW